MKKSTHSLTPLPKTIMYMRPNSWTLVSNTKKWDCTFLLLMFVVKVHVCFRPRTVHTTTLCGNLETKQHIVPVLLHTLYNYIMFVNSVHLLNRCDISTGCTSTASDHCYSMKKIHSCYCSVGLSFLTVKLSLSSCFFAIFITEWIPQSWWETVQP